MYSCKKRKGIPGGRARGHNVKNFLRFALIFVDLLPRCADLSNYKQFAPYVQKRLDTRPRCGYNGAGNLIAFAHRFCTGADLLLLKKFCPYPQKRLDNSRFCTYTGAGTTSVYHIAFALAPPRQKSQKIKRFFEIIGVVFHVEHLRAQKLFQR